MFASIRYIDPNVSRVAVRATPRTRCVIGNVVQFHPDRPDQIIHCNCKPAARKYTVVTKPCTFPVPSLYLPCTT